MLKRLYNLGKTETVLLEAGTDATVNATQQVIEMGEVDLLRAGTSAVFQLEIESVFKAKKFQAWRISLLFCYCEQFGQEGIKKRV